MPFSIRFSLLLFSIIFSYSLHSQPSQSDADRLHTKKNKLKTVNIYSLKLNKDIDKRTFLSQRMKFDEDGNVIEQIYFDSTDLEMFKWTNLYNTSHLIRGRVFCQYRDTIAKTNIQYDEKGFPSEETTQNADGVIFSKFSFRCDPKGKIISSTEEVFPEIQDFVKQSYKFDQQGYLILRFISDSKSHVKHDFKYEYTKSGLLSKVTEVGHDTVPFGWIAYDYERDGSVKTFSVKHENGKHFKVYYSYDGHGGMKSESKNLYLNTLLLDQEKNEFTLDSKGNIKKRLKYRMNNELSVLYNYTYEYYE